MKALSHPVWPRASHPPGHKPCSGGVEGGGTGFPSHPLASRTPVSLNTYLMDSQGARCVLPTTHTHPYTYMFEAVLPCTRPTVKGEHMFGEGT